MKNKILTVLFYRYKEFFEEMMISELIMMTPALLEEPAIDFLSKGKERLERWFLFQSYFLQRRSASDIKNAPTYQGALLYIAFFLKVISKEKSKREIPEPTGKEEKSLLEKTTDAISDLKNFGKEKLDSAQSVL
jgi:hypothetical protein